jgi:hypothetical protein
MHSTINVPGKDRVIKSPNKDTLPPNLVKWYTCCGISLGLNDYLFGTDAERG